MARMQPALLRTPADYSTAPSPLARTLRVATRPDHLKVSVAETNGNRTSGQKSALLRAIGDILTHKFDGNRASVLPGVAFPLGKDLEGNLPIGKELFARPI